MVRSTLLCRLFWRPLRAENPIQRKCGISIRARAYWQPGWFSRVISLWNSSSSIFADLDSWTQSPKTYNFDIQFPGIFAHVTPLLRQPAKVENPFENDFSGMFRNVFSKKWCAALSSVLCHGVPFGQKTQFNANVFFACMLGFVSNKTNFQWSIRF